MHKRAGHLPFNYLMRRKGEFWHQLRGNAAEQQFDKFLSYFTYTNPRSKCIKIKQVKFTSDITKLRFWRRLNNKENMTTIKYLKSQSRGTSVEMFWV